MTAALPTCYLETGRLRKPDKLRPQKAFVEVKSTKHRRLKTGGIITLQKLPKKVKERAAKTNQKKPKPEEGKQAEKCLFGTMD
jgi:hypothetical protein